MVLGIFSVGHYRCFITAASYVLLMYTRANMGGGGTDFSAMALDFPQGE